MTNAIYFIDGPLRGEYLAIPGDRFPPEYRVAMMPYLRAYDAAYRGESLPERERVLMGVYEITPRTRGRFPGDPVRDYRFAGVQV